MVKIILVHGNGGSSAQDHWLPYIKEQMEQVGIPVIAQTFPDNYLARSKYWIPFLKNDLKADDQTVIVGHSSGAVCAMRYAELYPILGSVLVATCYTDLGQESEKVSGYYDAPWQWDKIKEHQQWIVQFASNDDPCIPVEEARFVHNKLNSEYYEFTDRGHSCGDITLHEFKECVDVLKQKLLHKS